MTGNNVATEEDATVLVTGAGGTGGIATIKSLKRTTDFNVIGADMNPKAVGLYIADDKIVVPPATADEWVDIICRYFDKYEIDVVVPLIDEEVSQIEELRTTASDTGFVAPNGSFVETCLDKYRLMTELDKADITVPKTWTVNAATNLGEAEFPLVLKPRTDRGGRGVEIVKSPNELNEAITTTSRQPDELLVQEYLEGAEFTTSVVCTNENTVLSVVPKEAIRKDRSTVHGVTREVPEVSDSCHQIIDQFSPSGPINVQQICDDSGVPHVIEINPRFSSSACLTVASGVDELALLIKDALDLPYEIPSGFESNLHMFRYTDQQFVKDKDVLAGGTIETDEV